MTILSKELILQRIHKGLEGTSHFNEIEKESPEANVKKFFEDFEMEKQVIRDIAKKCHNISIEEKKLKSKNNELPILFNSIDFKGLRPANYDLRLGNEFW
jgi:hypothetical protein